MRVSLRTGATAGANHYESRQACWTRRRGRCSCYDRSLGALHPEVWQTQQFERVGFPLGEQVVHQAKTGGVR